MATFMTDLWESIFTPGTTPTLLVATNATFAALQVLLVVLLAATRSVHFFVLAALCGGLWWAINWFVAELAAQAALETAQNKPPPPPADPPASGDVADDEGDDTEVEPVAITPAPAAPGLLAAVNPHQPLAADIELLAPQTRADLKKLRGAASKTAAADKSELSTEDEWEKVSENEKDK